MCHICEDLYEEDELLASLKEPDTVRLTSFPACAENRTSPALGHQLHC